MAPAWVQIHLLSQGSGVGPDEACPRTFCPVSIPALWSQVTQPGCSRSGLSAGSQSLRREKGGRARCCTLGLDTDLKRQYWQNTTSLGFFSLRQSSSSLLTALYAQATHTASCPTFPEKILILSNRPQKTQGRFKAECFSVHTWANCFTQD